MKITNLTSQVSKLLRKGTPEVQKPAPATVVKKASDSVEISARTKDVESLVAKALSDPSDSDRVSSIKEKIANGTYEMDSKKLAEKMLLKD